MRTVRSPRRATRGGSVTTIVTFRVANATLPARSVEVYAIVYMLATGANVEMEERFPYMAKRLGSSGVVTMGAGGRASVTVVTISDVRSPLRRSKENAPRSMYSTPPSALRTTVPRVVTLGGIVSTTMTVR